MHMYITVGSSPVQTNVTGHERHYGAFLFVDRPERVGGAFLVWLLLTSLTSGSLPAPPPPPPVHQTRNTHKHLRTIKKPFTVLAVVAMTHNKLEPGYVLTQIDPNTVTKN